MIVSLLFFSVMVIAWGCQSVPISGRRQLVFVSEQKEIRLGAAAFQEILKSEPASTNQRYIDIVNRVGRRLAAVAGRDDYEWEFHVIASATPNAFCLPGGKVAFYEGILPICQSEAGVAVVMSHEIAHAIARHGGERMSHEMAVKGTGALLRIGPMAELNARNRSFYCKRMDSRPSTESFFRTAASTSLSRIQSG
jgi:predicted Zn-dependent protease